MSGSLGSLVVELSANIAQFQSDMGKAAYIAQKEMEKVNQAVDGVKKGFAMLGASFAAAGFVESLHGAVDQMDQLYLLSQRFSTSVETLSGLSLVAKNADVDMGTLAKGLKTLSKELAESPDKFQALGITTKNATEAFIKLATATKGLTDSDLTNFATKFLGKAGNELIPALSMTEEELRKLIARGSELSGITTEMSGRAHEYSDKMHEFEAATLGAKAALADKLLPTLTDVMEKMTEATAKSGLLVGAMAGYGELFKNLYFDGGKDNSAAGKQKEFITGISVEIQTLKSKLDALAPQNAPSILQRWIVGDPEKIKQQINGLEITLKSARASLAVIQAPAPAAATPNPNVLAAATCLARGGRMSGGECVMPEAPKTSGESFIEHLKLMAEKADLGQFAMLRLEAAQKKVSAGAEVYIKQLEAQTAKQQEAAKWEEHWAGLEADNKVIEDHIKGMRLTNEALEFQITLLGKTADEQAILTQARQADLATEAAIAALARDKNGFLVDPGAIDTIRADGDKMKKEGADAYEAMIAKQRTWSVGATKAFDEYTKDASNAARQAHDLFTDAYKGMEDALVNFVKTGKLDFKSMTDSIIADLIRIQVQQSMMPAMSAGINTVGSAIGSVLGFAGGGDPPVGVPSMVGENGPELFIPKTSGTIVPNSAMGGGNVVVNVTNNTNGNASVNTRQEGGKNIIDVFVEQAESKIAGNIARGNGPVSDALGRTFGLNRIAGSY